MKRFWTAAALVAVAVLGTACGDDDDTDRAGQQDLIDAMVSEGATEAQAECFIDELGFDEAERIYGADDADLSEDDMTKTLDAFDKCSGEDGSTDESTTDDDESDDEGAVADSGDDDTSDESAAGDLGELRSCVSDGGLEVGDSSAPAELNESLGILDTFTVISDAGGAGVVTLFEDGDLATEAREFQSETEGEVDGVTIGQVNEIVYSYSGDSDGLAALEDCVFS